MSRSLDERLERHFAAQGARPEFKMRIKGHDVFFADGGPHHDDPEQPEGYFVTAFAVQRGDAVGVQPIYFSANHDDTMLTDAGRKAARFNAAIKKAREHLEDGMQAGHYRA